MALRIRSYLKSFFEPEDKPTSIQFSELIDSCFNLAEDTLPIDKVDGLADALATASFAYVRFVDTLPDEGVVNSLYVLLETPPTFHIWNGQDWMIIGAETITLTATKSIGGISVGDEFDNATPQEFAKALVAPYVPPVLNSISITPGSTVEVGAVITLDSASLLWDKDSEGNVPYNAAINNLGFSSVNLGTGYSIQIAADANTTITRSTAGSQEWRFTAEDKDGNALSYKYDRVYWYWRRFFGASALEVTDDASAQTLIEALQQSWLDANRAGTATCTSDNANTANNTYIAYPASFGDLSGIIMNGATPVLGAFTKVGSFSYTNAQGVAVDMIIYKSNAKGAFSSGDSLVIS